DRPLFTGCRPSSVEGARAGGGAPRMSCSTDDHRISRASRGGPNVEGKAVRRARSACSSIIGTEPWVSSTSATSRTRGGFVWYRFLPLDVTRRPPLTLLAPDRR